ncbi:MAG: cation transporter [Lachnospiraceae bacterium]|nr:cation transporter [Lachnospiraceae bacterium]
MDREKTIVRTSIIGIAANLLLAAFKAVIGFASGSVAIITDAVNNVTDGLSSVITIIGAKYAGKKPDKEHPLGHGRAEYISAAVISVLVLYAGVTSLVESVKKIITPGEISYDYIQIGILIAAVFVKVFLGTYFTHIGKKVNSDSLVDSGKDAIGDVFISSAAIVAAIIYLIKGFSIEGYVGVLIGAFIIKAGFGMLMHTMDDIIGHRPDAELTRQIKETVCDLEGVYGVYDMILHNYGPDKYMGSLHVEIDASKNADEIDTLSRKITHTIYAKFGVVIESVGVYARDNIHPEVSEMRGKVSGIVFSHEHVLQMHGFRVDFDNKFILADIIIDFAAPDREGLYNHIVGDIAEAYPGFTPKIVLDIDASDL